MKRIYLNIATFLWYNRPKDMNTVKRIMSAYTVFVDAYQYCKSLCSGSQIWVFNRYLDEQIISVRYIDLENKNVTTLYNIFYPWLLPCYCLIKNSTWQIFKYGFSIKRVTEGRGLYEFSICHKGAILTVMARREQVAKWIENKDFSDPLDVVDHEAASDYLISMLSKRHKAQIYVAQAGEVDVTDAISSVVASFNKDSSLTAEEFYGYLASIHGKDRFPETEQVVLNIMDPENMDTTSFKDKDVIVLID